MYGYNSREVVHNFHQNYAERYVIPQTVVGCSDLNLWKSRLQQTDQIMDSKRQSCTNVITYPRFC